MVTISYNYLIRMLLSDNRKVFGCITGSKVYLISQYIIVINQSFNQSIGYHFDRCFKFNETTFTHTQRPAGHFNPKPTISKTNQV